VRSEEGESMATFSAKVPVEVTNEVADYRHRGTIPHYVLRELRDA
jgi:hypothetical protein